MNVYKVNCGRIEHYVKADSLFDALKVHRFNFPKIKDIWKVTNVIEVPDNRCVYGLEPNSNWYMAYGELKAPIC